MSNLGFTATNLRDIAELMEHLQHAAPIPRPDGKRLPVTVTLDAADRVNAETACTIRLYPDLDALAYFDGDLTAPYDAGVVARNQRVIEHEANTPDRGHDPDGACCRAAATGGDA